ncbi:MAG: hypothetical protein HYU36_03495 [Planctomycetes bacterium]|nr:hypothetical protein [Planctomycetota bacterium]
MPVFAHLASERNIASIRRSGIGLRKRRYRPRGVYALPVTRNFYVSHQWLRELKRAGGGTIAGVYFRIPDDEAAEVGRYNCPPVTMTAAEAVALLIALEQRGPTGQRIWLESTTTLWRGQRLLSSPEGYEITCPCEIESSSPEGCEVIIPRKIERSEIIRVRSLPQVVGWRYSPRAHGQPPYSDLSRERGQYGIRRLVRRVEEAKAGGRPTKIFISGRKQDSFRRVKRPRQQR